MTRDEAARLVNLITSTWPTGVRGHVWTDVLADLEHQLARDAYLHLRDTSEKPPPVAQFQAAYRARRAASKAVDEPPPVCGACDGTGWVQAADLIETVNGQPHPYSQVAPCRCTTGQAMRRVHAAIRCAPVR